TRFDCDWSSDVCSSDLDCDMVPRVLFASTGDRIVFHADTRLPHLPHIEGIGAAIDQALIPHQDDQVRTITDPGRYVVNSRTMPRSEERRVGKEGRSRRA